MARMSRPLAESLLAFLSPCDHDDSWRVPSSVSASALLSLALEVGGDDLTFFDSAEMLIWDVARHEGYDIPPYPLAGCGDAREFLSDAQVRSVPAWYEARGVDVGGGGRLCEQACLMARNGGFWRRVLPVPAMALESASALAPFLCEAIGFCLGDDDGAADPTLFSC
ncbi:MAG: hypothetical protein LKI25_05610 [Atopobiaceae bacterium]|jgi:hypothetical protein|nr:hypothetical protein [Atopobiaceae bacterium]MCI2173676.1 hypothetical protein [Atopobiaceae bacterium]MCI2207682.1 hypothetical protein [Atopobiaceae bacterium]